MTFTNILADVYRRCNYPSSPAADTVTRIKAFVNETHEALLAHPGLAKLLYGTLTFASVANQVRYGLAQTAQIRAMTDATNVLMITPRSLSWYRNVDPAPTIVTGTPLHYIPVGMVAVAQVPAVTGTGIWAASTAAGDTTQKVQLAAIRVGGYPHIPADTTLNGTTRVAIGSQTDYVDVTQCVLDVAATGDVSLYDAAAAGNVLAVIPKGQTSSRYWGFLLWPTPTSAVTYTIDVEHDVHTLAANSDEPQLPVRFHRLLAIGARVKEYEKTSDERLSVAQREYEQGVNDLLYAVTCPAELVIVPGDGSMDTGSNLSPWYPAGRW